MIEVMLDIGADGQVSLYNIAWPTVREDGFGVGAIGSVEGDIEEALAATDGGNPLVHASRLRQVMAVTNYLYEHFQLVSSRVTVLTLGVETSQIEYRLSGDTSGVVSEPEPEVTPVVRVSRYERSPVI